MPYSIVYHTLPPAPTFAFPWEYCCIINDFLDKKSCFSSFFLL
ncbi:hypothetical protein SELSPUOL_02260 [Selenomonas sputigena ATCC 35185]|uniref:Uncharacterized protein n=1 Tax=Selenomonas sputigena (strain ATCC 35185 / DSM 20758 / CCUG 44933 / VPI D19B-28) TaxID=546271 RepID=C9LXQ2_SELS3|nr:hypothetical protein SELSPUOL_02260 [Selenomonas sputigena ATCC 35185]